MAYNLQGNNLKSWTDWGKTQGWTGSINDANNDEYQRYIDDSKRADYSIDDRKNYDKWNAGRQEEEYQRLAPTLGNATGNQQFNKLREVHNNLIPKPTPIQQAYDPSGGRGFVPPNTSSNYPDVRGQNFAPGTGNPGPLSPPGGTGFAAINPQMNNQLSPAGGSGFYELNNPGMPDRPTGPIPMPKGGLPSNTGVVGPPMPTPDQLNGTGGIKPAGTYQPPTPGISPGNTPTSQMTRRQMPPNGGMQNNTLSGSLGGPPSSMGGLSTPRRQPGMPNPRPTRNFGSKLGANRGVI